MLQIISYIKDDLRVVSVLSCFVGYPVDNIKLAEGPNVARKKMKKISIFYSL